MIFFLYRISIIFRVKSAKAVKITDIDLIKRLGLIVGAFVLCLLIRTLVSPPVVIVGKKRATRKIRSAFFSSFFFNKIKTDPKIILRILEQFFFLLWPSRKEEMIFLSCVPAGRTSDHLKAFLCQSDWWDHSFTIRKQSLLRSNPFRTCEFKLLN